MRKIYIVPFHPLATLYKDKAFSPLDQFINIETLLELMFHSRNYYNPSSEIWTAIENNRAGFIFSKSPIPGISYEQMYDNDDCGIYEFLSVELDNFLSMSHELVNSYTDIEKIADSITKVSTVNDTLYLVVER